MTRIDQDQAADQPGILFLDFDEVFLNARAKTATGDLLDPVSAGLIRRMCVDADMRIVVSSTWRSTHTGCIDVLTRAGLIDLLWSPIVLPSDPSYDAAVHDDWRVQSQNHSRGDAVRAWLAAHPRIDRWLIIDDSFQDFDQQQLGRLIHTDLMFGVGLRDYDRAIRLMTGFRPSSPTDQDDQDHQTPRHTIANMARKALDALDQGDDDAVRTLLAIIRDQPLAQ